MYLSRRGRWRFIKKKLQELFKGGPTSNPRTWPIEQVWNATELAMEHGFRKRDINKYIGPL